MFANVSWPWLLLSGGLGTLVGIILCRFFPSALRRPPKYRFNLIAGLFSSAIFTSLAAFYSKNPLIVFPVGLVVGYLSSMVPMITLPSAPLVEDQKLRDAPFNRVLFRQDWDARPRFEKEQEGLFVGRRELLDRLVSDFISKRSGTILISGVRGVGKTALVERALLEARNKLQNRYWKRAKAELDNARFWQPVNTQIRQVLFELSADSVGGVNALNDHLSLKEAARQYAERRTRFFSRWFALTDPQVRRMHEASRAQLFVLKFNASDIGGALSEPGANSASGRPHINPEKLLKALIRKLYSTCHPTKSTPEARILRWSLTDKQQRNRFVERLESAYIKSTSTVYKETFSDVASEGTKRSKNTTLEAKLSIERILVLLLCLGICIYAGWKGYTNAWTPLKSLIAAGVPGAIAAYVAIRLTISRSWQTNSDRARQAQLSYEHDYSLAQMENDLEKIISSLHPEEDVKFNRNRCFTRTVIIFDELDKLEDPIRQLNDVITHFKNFFTLSDALFVFITDHEFYEHLCWEGAKALLERHYSPEHTFFTQKIYLRKPEFFHFQETIYRFSEPKGLEERVHSSVLDADLTDYLVQQKPDIFQALAALQSDTITHLFIHRQRYPTEQKELIERAFQSCGGWENPLAIARVWASQVASVVEGPALKETTKAFQAAKGWSSLDAVAFLKHHRTLFGKSEVRRIDRAYKDLKEPSLRDYVSVDYVPFTLSDLARALCFQTRNHYFDLYYMVYDYVGSYADSAPILHIENERFMREQRLWSRYQQLVEAAFYHRREGHPSREYFNALLMDSLYGVFDSRSTRGEVKLSDILFSPPILNGNVGATTSAAESQSIPAPWMMGSYVLSVQSGSTKGAASTQPVTSVAAKRAVSFVTPRDTQQINEAIIRLLRLAEARKAISAPQKLLAKLRSDELQTEELKDLTFTWNPDCEPVITQEGIDLELYESDLIGFWDQNKEELEAVDQELEKLWAYRVPPEESSAPQTRQLIADLRSMAEGLRRRIVTISRPDASALKTNIGTSESWPNLLLNCLWERIDEESDSEVLLAANLKTGPADPTFKAVFESRRTEVEMIARLPLGLVVFPHETESLVYMLAGPISSEVDEKLLQKFIQDSRIDILWCFPGKSKSVLKNYSSSVHFYFPPPANDSIVKCLLDYILLASAARLKQILPAAGAKEYKDRTLILRAGAELVGPLTGPSDTVTALTHPALKDAMAQCQQLPEVFKDLDASLRIYKIDWTKVRSAPRTVKEIAHNIASRSSKETNRYFNLELVIEGAILKCAGSDDNTFTADELRAKLMSSSPSDIARLVLQETLDDFLKKRLKLMGVDDPGFEPALSKHFVPAMLQSIEEVAAKNNVEIWLAPSSLTEWIAELEQSRAALKP